MAAKSINIILKATESCNLRCIYCYNCESDYGREVLSRERLVRFLEMLAFAYDRVNIIWHGGEPMLCGMEYMLFAVGVEERLYRKTGVVFSNSIQTNATLMDEQWIRFFKKYRFKVGVSFDGVTNSDYRQQTEKVQLSIRLLQRRKLSFGCLAVVADDNYDMLENYRFFRSHGIHFSFSPMFCEGGGEKLRALSAAVYVRKVKGLFDEWLYDSEGVNVRLFTDYIAMLFGSRTRTCTNGSCHGKWLGIDPNGNLYNCGRDTMKRYPFGNVDDMLNIGEAFLSEGFRDMLFGAIERRKKCMAGCKLFPYCESGCSDCAMIENGIDQISTFSCETFRQIFPYVQKGMQEIMEKKTPLSQLNPAVRQIMLRCMAD